MNLTGPCEARHSLWLNPQYWWLLLVIAFDTETQIRCHVLTSLRICGLVQLGISGIKVAKTAELAQKAFGTSVLHVRSTSRPTPPTLALVWYTTRVQLAHNHKDT